MQYLKRVLFFNLSCALLFLGTLFLPIQVYASADFCPPIPVATADVLYGTFPLTVNFDASGSNSPCGQPLLYFWTFEPGKQGSGVNVTHTFTKPGKYTVSLVINNNSFPPLGASTTIDIIVIAPVGNYMVELDPVDDARMQSGVGYNDGTLDLNAAGTSNRKVSFLRFDTEGVCGTILSSKLRMTHVGPSATGNVQVFKATNTTWSEGNLSPANMPSAIPPELDAISKTYVGDTEWDLGLTTKEIFTLALDTDTAGENFIFASSEENFPSYRPKLLVQVDNSAGDCYCPDPNASLDVVIDPRVMLGGPYDSGTGAMKDDLRLANLIPFNDPYGLGYSLPAFAFIGTGTSSLVDWVTVELRDATAPSTVIAEQAAAIRKDGHIVSAVGFDFTNLVTFVGVPHGNYYVAVRHRNHLGVMSSAPLALSDVVTTVDFTDPTTPTYTLIGADAMTDISGTMVLKPGDANGDKQVIYNGNANDRNAVLSIVGIFSPSVIISGYYREDCNMDGQVIYNGNGNDRNVILGTVGIFNPSVIISEQIP